MYKVLTSVFMLQGSWEKKASRVPEGSRGLLAPMAVREKKGMLDRRVPEVCFLFDIFTLGFNPYLTVHSWTGSAM